MAIYSKTRIEIRPVLTAFEKRTFKFYRVLSPWRFDFDTDTDFDWLASLTSLDVRKACTNHLP